MSDRSSPENRDRARLARSLLGDGRSTTQRMASMQSGMEDWYELSGSFGERLRRERERRQISIVSIAQSTKILGALLEGLERDDVSRWPTGLYRRSFFRAYAAAIGLNPEPLLREFIERFPDPEGQAALPASVRGRSVNSSGANAPVLRLTLADTGFWFKGGAIVRRFGSRCTAVAIDAAVLTAVGVSLFLALGVFWMPLSIALGCYYFGSILILGNTPGVCLCASRSSGRSDQERWRKPGHVLSFVVDKVAQVTRPAHEPEPEHAEART